MDKKSRGAIGVGVEQWGGGITIGGVEQLRGVVVIANDERCFLVMLRLKNLKWSCNSKCDPKLNAILHIKMIVFRSNFLKYTKILSQCYLFCFFYLVPFYHVNTHLWMIMMESIIIMVQNIII
jgi:hypothetical protein